MSSKRYCISLFLIAAVALSAAALGSRTKVNDRVWLQENSSLCLNCHEDQGKSLEGTVHALASADEMKSSFGSGCVGCHDGWEVHINDPSPDNIGKPQTLSAKEQAEVCGRCHLSPHQSAMATTDVHHRANVACLDCHSIHGNHKSGLVKDEAQNFCASCHPAVKAEFSRRSAHPLRSGNIDCTNCHSLSGIKDPLMAVGLDWKCQNCHSEKSGPFLFEHGAINKHLIDGGGCVECHEPHGSANDRLLVQAGNGNCLKCHDIPPAHRTMHNGLGNRLECVFCHTDIHGSYDNKKFLDPNLGVKLFPDCYQSGCHDNLND
ncbi:MAG: hypothetical protein HRF51_11280 [bacterium]|jgi:DmsE family decaheme c-type cytochrome